VVCNKINSINNLIQIKMTKAEQTKLTNLQGKDSLTEVETKQLNDLLVKSKAEAAGLLSYDVYDGCPSAPISSVGLSVEPICSLSLGKFTPFNVESYKTANANKPTKMQWINDMVSSYGDKFVSIKCKFVNKQDTIETSLFLPTLKTLGNKPMLNQSGVLVANNDKFTFGLNNGVPICRAKDVNDVNV
jgi:hypothetical protein